MAYVCVGIVDKKKGTIVWRRQFQDFLALKGTIIARFLISLCSNDRQSRARFQISYLASLKRSAKAVQNFKI